MRISLICLVVTDRSTQGATVPLHDLPRGARGTIAHLHTPQDAGDREVLLRLIELGFLPGESVHMVARAAAGAEPVAVRVGEQATFALRRREAALVHVQTQEPPA